MQLDLLETKTATDEANRLRARSGTYVDNMKRPVYRWFRFSAGYSGQWVEDSIVEHRTTEDFRVLDPFAGSGTTLLAADACGVRSVGYEAQPFIARLARSKLSWHSSVSIYEEVSSKLLERARKFDISTDRLSIPLLSKCYTSESFKQLEALRIAYVELSASLSEAMRDLLWLNITATLRISSHVGTAQWQYVLPKKTKAKTLSPFDAFTQKRAEIVKDMRFAESQSWCNGSTLVEDDIRFRGDQVELFDLVITSPPYPNNYDYADATRLEMTFWGDVKSWSELHDHARKLLVRSCSQHSAKERLALEDLLPDTALAPIEDELTQACASLAQLRLEKVGKKTYHTMAAAYFLDLADIIHALRGRVRSGGRMCFVVGDSAPYGVHLPVDRWLGELAISAGFRAYSFEKLRDRNVKWKNRKHRVPLHEGRLWIEG